MAKKKAPKGVKPIDNPGKDYGWRRGTFNVIGNNNNRWGWNIPIPPDQPAFNIGDPNFYLGTAPPAATSTPTSAAPNVPPYNPQPNPYALGAGRGNAPTAQEFAPNLTNGNVPAGGSYADWQEWNRQMEASDPNWNYYNPYNSQYAWQWNPREPGTLMAGADPRSQEGVPWHEALNIPWSSSYAPEYYKNQQAKQYTWVGGREGGASSKGTGRMPQRYYIPKQEFYKTPGGKTYASRDGWEDAFGKDDENPAGNNNMKTIPAWVGPLVSWRT